MMKPIKLHTTKCIACNKEVVTMNMIRWNGKMYGKGCFNRHIKPLLDAKKLEGKEFYKVVDKTVIGIIANQESKNYFEKSIVESAGKGFLTGKQIRMYVNGLELNKRAEIIVSVLEVLSLDVNPTYLVDMTQQWLGKTSYTKDSYEKMKETSSKEERKAYSILSQKQAMQTLNELYNNNEHFKYIVDARYKNKNSKANIIEYCLDTNMFGYYEELLEDKLDKLA